VAVTASRRCAFAVVRRVFEQDAYADRAFRAEADRLGLSGRDRSFAMRLAYGTVQRKLTLDFVIERFADREPDALDAAVLAALRLGLYQIAFMERVPDHAAVGESVELAKGAKSRGHGLVNAILRRATREATGLIASLGEQTAADAAIKHSHPEWIAELWWDALGPDQARLLMDRDNQPAESAVRVNTLRGGGDELLEAFAALEIEAHADADISDAIVLDEPFDVHGSDLYERGLLASQSRASMLVSQALAPQPGERVLDLCAAPGAKTAHLAALMENDGQIVAVERDSARAPAVAANCERLGVTCATLEVGDAAVASFGGDYDRVLVDPPCSDLGTLQSRPDVRWRKNPRQVAELRLLQASILSAGAEALRPGGTLVYSTCTISPDENERQIEALLGRHRFETVDLSLRFPRFAQAGSRHLLQTLPQRDATDGFFVAALRKRD
jgi:16S rRNA (cytosine967-C5)-methyltransferase